MYQLSKVSIIRLYHYLTCLSLTSTVLIILSSEAARSVSYLQTAPLEALVFYNKFFHPGDGIDGCQDVHAYPQVLCTAHPVFRLVRCCAQLRC